MSNFRVTKEQAVVLKALTDWLKTGPSQYITLGGYAGTGKTTLTGFLRLLIAKLQPKAKVAFCAYTGKASRVLEAALKKSAALDENDSVSTIHSLIYSVVVDEKGKMVGWKRKTKIRADLIMVDEASMVTEEIWQDLLDYEIPVIAVGDHGQLPPIGGKFNLMANPQLKLETIHRQAAGNPIIQLSMQARVTGTVDVGKYGAGVRKLDRYDSATGQEVEEMLARINEELMVLTGFNWTRIKLNQEMRVMRDFEGESPKVGDKVICLKNNWEVGIYNGMSGIIKRIIPAEKKWADQAYEAEILMEDDLMYEGLINKTQFGSEKTLIGQVGDLFDFGYALTVHKAQGSQSPRVLLFEERNKHMTDDDWRRWLYTGITRAERELTIVGS